jgi:hypothetical protein
MFQYTKVAFSATSTTCGVSPSNIFRQQKQKPDVTEGEIDRFIAHAGADRVLAALDRLTGPPFAFAAE